MDEHGIVWEALIRVLVEAEIQSWLAADISPKILFKIRTVESLDRIFGQFGEVQVSLLTQIKTGQFVVPRMIGKVSDGPAIHFFLFCTESILIEKFGKALIQTRIIRIVIDFGSQNCERRWDLIQLNKPRQVAFQDAR